MKRLSAGALAALTLIGLSSTAFAQFDGPPRRFRGEVEDPPAVRVTPRGSLEVVREDCHRQPRRHYLDDYGRRVLHYHRGPNCRVILAEEVEEEVVEDCHRDVRLHSVRGYGRIYHSHRGPRCRVVEYDVYDQGRDDGPPPRSCLQIGRVTVCP